MKKIITIISVLIMICSSYLYCASLLANKFFSEDIQKVVIDEVNIKGRIDDVFAQISSNIPGIDQKALTTIREDLKSNQVIDEQIGDAAEIMLEDIIYDQPTQDMNALAKTIIFSYETEIETALFPFLDKTQIESAMNTLVDSIPLQEVYNSTVSSLKESVPPSYIQLLKAMKSMANDTVKLISIVLYCGSVMLIVFFNRRHFEWAFSIGVGSMISVITFLLGGFVIPQIYHAKLQGLGQSISAFMDVDFSIITQFGIGLMIVAIICLLLHFLIARKYME